MSVKEEIFKRARTLAEEEVKDSNRISGWESIRDAAAVLLESDPIPYIVMATVDYLDQEEGKS